MLKKKIKLIVLDVDGVLTNGQLFIGTDGTEYKSFHCQDGLGITLAKYAGIKFAIITGRKSRAVSIRAEELGIDFIYQGVNAKLEKLDELLAELGYNYKEVCYIGDDLNDLPILERIGFSAAPSNAVPFVKSRVDFVTERPGGSGAVREVIDRLLVDLHDYDALVSGFIADKVKVKQ
ncbi:HAD hydrolase family protein [Terrilactibacillus sp. S3-3]|nr:HAD hydrolase family protein [Terrilactibacillus sp. S3-3]